MSAPAFQRLMGFVGWCLLGGGLLNLMRAEGMAGIRHFFDVDWALSYRRPTSAFLPRGFGGIVLKVLMRASILIGLGLIAWDIAR
jgi:hypothetical protein